MGKPMKVNIWMGNVDTMDGHTDPGGKLVKTHLPGRRVFSIGVPLASYRDAFSIVTAPTGAWASHSWAPPAWVVSNDKGLEAALALFYDCPAGAPEDIDEWIGGDRVPRAEEGVSK